MRERKKKKSSEKEREGERNKKLHVEKKNERGIGKKIRRGGMYIFFTNHTCNPQIYFSLIIHLIIFINKTDSLILLSLHNLEINIYLYNF